ncbi:hypothetical protein V2G26_006197 [Clonostachys chloroleuca]
MEFRLKAYTDQDGKERLFMGVVTTGKVLPSNMMSPVQGLNPGIAMGICSLGNTSSLDAAVSIAGDHSQHKHRPHTAHVFLWSVLLGTIPMVIRAPFLPDMTGYL